MTRRLMSPQGRLRASWGLAALWLSGACHGADAPGSMRDPMRPPAAMQAPVSEPAGAAASVEVTPRHLMVIDGRRYLIVAGRRLGVGDRLGTARIERLDDGSVWLREAGVLRHVSLIGGIVKRATPPPAPIANSFPNR